MAGLIDWPMVINGLGAVSAALGALFFKRAEAARKSASGEIQKLNGHVEEVEKLKAMRRHVLNQGRRIAVLERGQRIDAIERRRLQQRIEVLESRGA